MLNLYKLLFAQENGVLIGSRFLKTVLLWNMHYFKNKLRRL